MIRRENTFRGYGYRSPFYWVYRTVGPDGRHFDNDSIVTLRRVLRNRYGRGLKILEAWNKP